MGPSLALIGRAEVLDALARRDIRLVKLVLAGATARHRVELARFPTTFSVVARVVWRG